MYETVHIWYLEHIPNLNVSYIRNKIKLFLFFYLLSNILRKIY